VLGGAPRPDSPGALLDKLLGKLLEVTPPAGDEDVSLLREHLAALPVSMLRDLTAAGYTLKLSRHRMSNADAALRDVVIGGGAGRPGFLADLADGIHQHNAGGERSLVLRTRLVDGQLRFELPTLLHELGHAYDFVLGERRNAKAVAVRAAPARGQDPLHVDKAFADAFAKEHARLAPYFHVQEEFFAESFALFLLDPVRCRRLLPETYAYFYERFAALEPDPAKFFELERAFDRAAVAVPGAAADLRDQLAFHAAENRALREKGLPTQPLLVHLEGKRDWGLDDFVTQASRKVRASYAAPVGAYRSDECRVVLRPGEFADANKVQKVLEELELTGRAAVIHVPDADQLAAGSAGFAPRRASPR
jgi:hypothetical protein